MRDVAGSLEPGEDDVYDDKDEEDDKDDDKDKFKDGDPVRDVAGSSEPGEEPFSVQRPLANRKGALVLAL